MTSFLSLQKNRGEYIVVDSLCKNPNPKIIFTPYIIYTQDPPPQDTSNFSGPVNNNFYNVMMYHLSVG